MFKIGEEIHIEDEADRRVAYIAAIAADPHKASPLPQLENLQTPFTLSAASAHFIEQGLANIAMDRYGIAYDGVSPEVADRKIAELYGQIEGPEDFSSPLPERPPRQD